MANKSHTRAAEHQFGIQFTWLHLSLSIWQAVLEAQQVISLRLSLLASGSEAAVAETARMVSEKMSAALEVQQAAAVAAMTGNPGLIPARTIVIYRRLIRANRRRLRAGKISAAEIARRAIEGALS